MILSLHEQLSIVKKCNFTLVVGIEKENNFLHTYIYIHICKRTKTDRYVGNHGTYLSSTTEAGHSVTLSQVVETCPGKLRRSDDGVCPGVKRVQAILLPAHARVMTCWSLVGHVLHTTRREWAGGRWSREGHIQVTNWLLTLAVWGV